MHVPVHASLQHTPSAQKPLEHWSAVVHAVAVGRVGVQVPPLLVVSQKLPPAHCASCEHAVQTPVLQ
jgi:hypothetical protein